MLFARKTRFCHFQSKKWLLLLWFDTLDVVNGCIVDTYEKNFAEGRTVHVGARAK
ncbi:hypothetical protein BRCON_2152 [Candidatus Sumerlaea chitinivorans]|uniref:Uncharacterized protein n=1 Tax=Sumerlaea chitinivorans TaxID=2250252 RepID=A0A2Z4Y7Q5_SUMC1|nr:hypothetical protein BRCON_2152 [Candidatus Sumerlaea chitinivorans]